MLLFSIVFGVGYEAPCHMYHGAKTVSLAQMFLYLDRWTAGSDRIDLLGLGPG
jgi:hypothetical protein